MKRLLTLALLGLYVAALPMGAEPLPANATSVSSPFLNLNAGDSGSYSDTSPSLWNDLGPGGRNGTIVGGLTYNSTTKALQFPGNINNYVDMGAGFDDFGSGITIEFEGHFGSANQGWERIFDFGNGDGQDNIWVGVLGPYPDVQNGPLNYDRPNRLAVEIWRDDLSPKFKPGLCYTTNADLATNSFDKWVITLDGTTCRMYKNGVQVNVTRWTAETFQTTSGLGVGYPFLPRNTTRTKNYIGKSNWTADPAFDGAIKYVRIYTSALTSNQVENNATTYTLTYVSTGADSGSAPATKTGNGLITLDGNTGNMMKTGHTFSGWATTEGASTAISGSYNLTANTTLHPVWIPIPSAPRISVSRASPTSLTVALTEPAFNSQSVDGYQVQFSTNGTTWTTASSNVAAGASSYTLSGLTTGTPYYVRVAAKYSGQLSAYGYNWQPIYEVTSPTRTSTMGPITYASGFGIEDGDAATTHASTVFTRVRYRMAATYGGTNNYVDANFLRSLGTKTTYSETFSDITRLRVPTTSSGDPAVADPNHFEIHANVSDMYVESNVSGVQNGSGFDGRLELWPWDYEVESASDLPARTASTYDDSDSPVLALRPLEPSFRSKYGSFQLHRLSASDTDKRTLFAWNRHGEVLPEVGFGQYSGSNSDWTFAATDASYQNTPRTNFNLKIFIDLPVTPTPNTATISYAVGAAGSGPTPSTPTSVSEGSTFITPANTFIREGYTFAGWNDGVSTYLEGVTYPATGSVSGNVVLTAQWTAIPYTVTYNTHGGTTVADDTYTIGSTITLPTAPTRNGHTFTGWFTTSSGGTALGATYQPPSTGDITLHAQWSANSYIVTYEEHGGSTVPDGSFTQGGTLTYPSPPTRNGYTFQGWFAADTGGTALTSTQVAAGNTNITLHAQWTPISYTVTYNTHGGSTAADDTYTIGATITLPTAPTRNGYTFTGWFTTDTGGTALGSTYQPPSTGNITLHAQWTEVTPDSPNTPTPPSQDDEPDNTPSTPDTSTDASNTTETNATANPNNEVIPLAPLGNVSTEKITSATNGSTSSTSRLPIAGDQFAARIATALMAIVGGALLMRRRHYT